jgi:hypothetical protein
VPIQPADSSAAGGRRIGLGVSNAWRRPEPQASDLFVASVAHLLRGRFDGSDDPGVSGAPAQVAAEPDPDLFASRVWVAIEECDR